jgi:hypothetical protein
VHGLFQWLNTPGDERPAHGMYQGVPHANGGLFERPARIHLLVDELHDLRAAADFNWRLVEPAIFGALLEGGLGHDKQWALGAHYTHEADILEAVGPTIADPWRERIENLSSHRQALAAQADLMRYVVLDPACGSGNFLYVAYRELRRIERRLAEREAELRQREGLREQGSLNLFPLANIRGIEIDGFAVALARVTLWMGHKLAVDELGILERTLPLADLSGIATGDALRMPWPRADAIVGNPPFHGSQNLRRVLGPAYLKWLEDEFRVGVKDYCVYWFRKAHDQLADGGRAGLVGTNSISQNRARGASLDYIVANGGVITAAVSSQDWPGEAAVDVSIVNWVKAPAAPPTAFRLDGEEVAGITTALRPVGSEVATAARLAANAGRSFQGPQPVGAGFLLEPEEAATLHARTDADYREVVRPYLVGEDIATEPRQQPTRFVIDFAARPLEEAMQWPAALEIVRERVKPFRDRNARAIRRERWWLLGETVPKMRAALAPLPRYIAGTATGKRILFAWCEPWTCPSNATNVFAFADDYSFGVLSSSVHRGWARLQSSTLEDRIRYTPTSAFETFPWPSPVARAARAEVGELAAAMVALRGETCAREDFGLTRLYNLVDEGAYAEIADLHRRLDAAVVRAYGWPASAAGDPEESNRLLHELNQEITRGERPYEPFAG